MAFVDQQDPFCKIVTCIDAWDRCYPVLFWVVALHWMIVSSLFVGQGLMGATVASFLIYLRHQLNLRCLDGKSVDGQHSQALNNCKESIFCLWSRLWNMACRVLELLIEALQFSVIFIVCIKYVSSMLGSWEGPFIQWFALMIISQRGTIK